MVALNNSSIKVSVLDGFADMVRSDGGAIVHIGYRSSHTQYPGVGSCGKPQPMERHFHDRF